MRAALLAPILPRVGSSHFDEKNLILIGHYIIPFNFFSESSFNSYPFVPVVTVLCAAAHYNRAVLDIAWPLQEIFPLCTAKGTP